MVYPYPKYRILFGNRKEWSTDTYFTLDYPKINRLIKGNWSHILSNIKNKKIYRKSRLMVA